MKKAVQASSPKTSKPKAAPKAKVAKAPKAQAPVSHGTGRRKSSIARVWLRRGNGEITVNGRDFKEYFDVEINRMEAYSPFKICPISANYSVTANIGGGGVNSQAGALKLGIARALVAIDENSRHVLREHGMLTSDSRIKERKKYGQKAARRKFQFVKR
jgi:small subunit ribosomal protein S9